jgi:hypothetical protein
MRTLEELVSAKAESPLLKEGSHIVHLISKIDCTSFQDVELIDGNLRFVSNKINLPKWNTPTEQTAILVGNEAGVCCDRLSWDVWKKPKDLDASDGDITQFTTAGDYAVHVVDGKLERIPRGPFVKCGDELVNAGVAKKMKHFLFVLAGGKENLPGKDIVANAIANKIPFVVNIKKTTWTNPATNETIIQYRIDSFDVIKDGIVPAKASKPAELVVPEDLAS